MTSSQDPNRVREVREAKGITQLQLFRLSGIAPCNISSIELCRVPAYPGWRKRLADALDTPQQELFPESEEGINGGR